MAATPPPSLRSSLERLKNAGAVNGLLLGWRRQVLINALPYEPFRAERLLEMAHDARDHFGSADHRKIQTFWFGYDTVHMLIGFSQDTVVIALHARAEEADFLRRAMQTFLDDTQLPVESLMAPALPEEEQFQGDSEPAPEAPASTNFIGRMV